ncbi:hypothetical protein GT044_20835 [Streptomyces sp. SID335]|nr:hypothetical protein [Streptomyces sp. SID335]MYZ16722.1 hypothetical protein [Streptomyces sp. SID337]NEA01829.1 hypothetical protein [Streptomyces sp. SID10116]NEB45971.1 hypothetical protein [Streptomyces sp. SID339]
MLTRIANGRTLRTTDTSAPLSSPCPSLSAFWPRVRQFAVPTAMIEKATARRVVGDWAGACSAARFDIDFGLRAVAHTHGRHVADQLRSDLRHLAPDLLRWHMPRIAPDGLLRPGLTVALARYEAADPAGVRPLRLVARTPPAWADAGQRISLALWDGARARADPPHHHPHPHPHRRFRLDLHRHLWDARRAGELRARSGTGAPDPQWRHCAVDRWADEAALLLHTDGRPAGPVVVRLGAGRRLLMEPGPDVDAVGIGHPSGSTVAPPSVGDISALPVLPDASTWILPDLELLRTGAVTAERLHPLVAASLLPDSTPAGPSTAPAARRPRIVECRGARHRIGLVDGVLAPLDHDAAEIRREELLAALSGTPLPCLRVIDEAHRSPDALTGVRERLDHGDVDGALAVIEDLLGPEALLRDGPLRDELETAARRRVTHGLYRAGLIGSAPSPAHPGPGARRDVRSHPRHSSTR